MFFSKVLKNVVIYLIPDGLAPLMLACKKGDGVDVGYEEDKMGAGASGGVDSCATLVSEMLAQGASIDATYQRTGMQGNISSRLP